MTHTPSLRIGIFADDFYPNSGGVARSIELQIAELTAMGHDVTLFVPDVQFVPPTNCDYEALPVIHIPGTPSFLCSVRFGKRMVNELSDRYEFDLVHSQNERGSMFLAAQIARKKGIPHVHTFHSNYAGTHNAAPLLSAINTFTYMRLAPFIMKQLRSDKILPRVRYPRHLPASEHSHLAKFDWQSVARLAQFTDAFTSPADFVISNINDATHQQIADRGFVVANGVNRVFAHAERIRSYDDTVRFLSCGRLDPEKRVDAIVNAFAKLNKEDAELYILGAGIDEKKLRRIAERKVKKGRVVFLGHYEDHERVANEFANADVFVLGSYHFDTQGMVLGEAASSGTAILYVDERLKIGVSDQNALLVSPSVTGIHDGMLRLYKDRALRLRMNEASKALANTLTPTVMEQAFVDAYKYAIRFYK